MYVSLLKPFSYLSLFPLFFFVVLMLIPRESGVVMFISSFFLLLFMNYTQLASASVVIGFFLAGIFATRIKEAEDFEVLVFIFIWLLLVSFLGSPYAIYMIAIALILFAISFKKTGVLILLLLLILTPISLKNWKWWELIGSKPSNTYQMKPVYNRQIDPVMKMAGENDEGAGTLSDSAQQYETRYILQMDYILSLLLLITSLLFIISFLRVIKLAIRYKKTVLPDFVIAGVLIISSFILISSTIKLYQKPMIKTMIVKREIFKFSNPSPSKIAAVGYNTDPKTELSSPYQPIKWDLDAISRLTGIIILLVSLYLLYKLTRTLFETSISADKEIKIRDGFKVKEKGFQLKFFSSYQGSNLIKVAYETYRECIDKDLELTPFEFLTKYPHPALNEITQEYIITEYGLKPTRIPDIEVRSWIKELEQTLS
jgi:hypothetical protein